MVRRFQLGRFKVIERVARRIGPQRRGRCAALPQQQGDQIQGALEQPVEPVICSHGSTPGRQQQPDTGQPSNPTST